MSHWTLLYLASEPHGEELCPRQLSFRTNPPSQPVEGLAVSFLLTPIAEVWLNPYGHVLWGLRPLNSQAFPGDA